MSGARAATFSLCILGSLFTLGVMVASGRGWTQAAEWWMSFLGIGLWNLSPYAGLAACGVLAKRTKGQARTAFVGSVLVVGFGVFVLVEGFIVNPEAQSALAFVVLPLYQLAGVGVLIIVIRSVGGRASRRGS